MSNRPLREDLVSQACLEAYGLVRHEKWLADRALDHVLRPKKNLYSTERRAVTERVYAVLRKQRLLDFLLPKAFGDLSRRSPTQLDLLRFAAERVLAGENPSLVTDALQLPGELSQSLVALANSDALEKLPKALRFAIESSLPDSLAARFYEELQDETQAAIDALNKRAPLCIRTNTLKTTRDELQKKLEEAGCKVTPTLLSPLGLILETRVNVYALEAFKQGLFEVQDEGSQLLGMIVDAPPTKCVDACAGAGGKTLQLAAQMKNRGDLYAFDIDAKRLEELKARARRAGVHNTRVQALPIDDAEADAAVAALVGKIDRVFIDAPCTGTGTLRRKPDARYRFDDAMLADHTARQAAILERFAKLTKPGGRCVYGTCSILREENEEIVNGFLAKHPEFTLVSADKWLGGAQGLTRDGMLRLHTHKHQTDGFFGAVLERKK